MSPPKQRSLLDRGQRRVARSMQYEPQSLRRRVVANENIPPGYSVERAFRPVRHPDGEHSLFREVPFHSAYRNEHPWLHHDNDDKPNAGMQRVE
jgi:hypothetical protein